MRPDKFRYERETRGFSSARAPSVAADLDLLLGDLCARWGFCNRLAGIDLLDSNGSVTADDFAEHVLLAEGMDPSLEIDWRRAMKRVFVARFSGPEVSVATYGA
jgi:hypothetical protein